MQRTISLGGRVILFSWTTLSANLPPFTSAFLCARKRQALNHLSHSFSRMSCGRDLCYTNRQQNIEIQSSLITMPEPDDKTRLISLADAAAMYGFNPRFLGELARKGKLKANKVGNMWITTPADVETYIVARKRTGLFRDDIKTSD